MKTPTPASCRAIAAKSLLAAAIGIGLGPAMAADLPPGCQEGIPSTCRYHSDEAYADLRQFDFQGVVGNLGTNGHVVPFRVRWPAAGTGRMPLVIWSHHGPVSSPVVTPGGSLFVEGMAQSERRARSFAAAGYVVVHLGRTEPTGLTDVDTALCTQIGLGYVVNGVFERCSQLHGNYEYGPRIVEWFVRRLRAGAALLPAALANRVDLDRVVVAGRGIGAVIGYATAGVRLHWEPAPGKQRGLTFQPVRVPGVVAYYADAPDAPTLSGQGGNGVGDRDLLALSGLPMMLVSGRHEDAADGGRSARSAPWQMAPRGSKYLAWDGLGVLRGATLCLESGGCNTVAEMAACDALEMLGVAYLDAVVKQKPEATRWLNSDAFKELTSGLMELHRR